MQYRVIRPSTAGRRGDVLDGLDTNRARQLVAAGLIEPIEAPKPAKKKARKKKGGKTPDSANPSETVERK